MTREQKRKCQYDVRYVPVDRSWIYHGISADLDGRGYL